MTTWKWMPGMRTKSGVRVVAVDDDGYTTGFLEKQGYVLEITEEMDPDWTDPATVGCLMYQVRQARGEPWYYPTALTIEVIEEQEELEPEQDDYEMRRPYCSDRTCGATDCSVCYGWA